MFKKLYELLFSSSTDEELENTENTEITSQEESWEGKRYKLQFLKEGHVVQCEGIVVEDNDDEKYIEFQVVQECVPSDVPVLSEHFKYLLTPIKIEYKYISKAARVYDCSAW